LGEEVERVRDWWGCLGGKRRVVKRMMGRDEDMYK
jgi:hypothetical protein